MTRPRRPPAWQVRDGQRAAVAVADEVRGFDYGFRLGTYFKWRADGNFPALWPADDHGS